MAKRTYQPPEIRVKIIRGNDEEAKQRFLNYCCKLAVELAERKEREAASKVNNDSPA